MLRALLVATLAGLAFAAPASAQDRIVGGSSTTIEEWPWQVAIAEPPSAGGNGFQRQFCGGSLVSSTVVLTAAHCVVGGSGQFSLPPSDFSVITGRTVLSSTQGAEIPAVDLVYPIAGGGGAPVPESQLAPGQGPQLYDDDSSRWDFALLELASPAPAPAQPIQLAQASEWAEADPVWVTGWGSTVFRGPGSDTLLEAQVNITGDSDCANAYTNFDPVTMVCAAALGKDTCQGDSGGPLVKDLDPGAGFTWRLVGDTSFGEACAVPAFPGVYGKVGADPMRGAVTAGVTFAQNTNTVGGGSGADTVAPKTRIGERPPARSRRRRAKIEWTANEPATFECSLDGRAFAPCESPFSKKVSRKRHNFRVRATDQAKNVEAEPAEVGWKVRKKRRR